MFKLDPSAEIAYRHEQVQRSARRRQRPAKDSTRRRWSWLSRRRSPTVASAPSAPLSVAARAVGIAELRG
jgi:hypothetical protein